VIWTIYITLLGWVRDFLVAYYTASCIIWQLVYVHVVSQGLCSIETHYIEPHAYGNLYLVYASSNTGQSNFGKETTSVSRSDTEY
jgi:hypothetical protein